MDNYLTTIMVTIILIISTISSNFFFSLTNITLDSFLTINIFPLLNAIISIWFILFLIFASLSLACILIILRYANYQYALGFSIVGYILGVTLGTILFGNTGFLVVLLIGIIGIPLALEAITKKEKEYKSLPILRSGISAAGRITIILSIGLALFVFIITFNSYQTYEEQFITETLNTTIGNDKSFGEILQDPLVELIVDSQKQTIETVKKMPGFSNLKSKNDEDVLTFVTSFEVFENMVNSNKYKETIKTQLQEQQDSQKTNEQLLEQIPMIKEMSKLAWILYVISAFIITSFIGSLIIKNLAGIIYVFLSKILPKQQHGYSNDFDETEDNSNY